MERVDEELADKRAEFKERMQHCSEKQIEIQKKQQKVKCPQWCMQGIVNRNSVLKEHSLSTPKSITSLHRDQPVANVHWFRHVSRHM